MSSRDATTTHGMLVVGANHRTAPIELRESLALDADQVRASLQVIRGEQVLTESMILSTCNRTEVYSLSPDPARAETYVRDLLARVKGRDLLRPPHTYALRDREMAAHLFRVAASLDSMIVGEMQILGQVKDAFEIASQSGSAGALLGRLLAGALRVGKRARAETSIGAGAVSVASAAVDLTTKIMSDLSDKRVLLVGAGATGRLAAQHFAELHPAALLIANRTREKAHELARQLSGEPLHLSDLPAALPRADVVVCATSSPDILIDAAMVKAAMRERRQRAMVIVDIAVPRNVDPAVAKLENVFAYPIDALKGLVDGNLARRRKEIPAVEAIVAEELDKFFGWTRTLQVAPMIRSLRDRYEAVRSEEVEKHLKHFPAAEHERVQALTRAIMNKLLHHPTITIKRLDAETDEGIATLDAACDLFGIEPAPDGTDGKTGSS